MPATPALGIVCLRFDRVGSGRFDSRQVSAHGYAICVDCAALGHDADPDHPDDVPPAPFRLISEATR